MIRRVVVAVVALLATGCPPSKPAAPTPPPAQTTEAPKANGTTAKPPAPAPKPFDRASARTPWRLTKVGDWATYNSSLGKVKKVKFEVTAVTDSTVTFVRKNADSGAELGTATVELAEEESRYKPWESYDALVQPPYKEKITVAGKELEATVIKRAASGNSTELWVAENDVPPFNQCAIKSLRDGKLELELVDFGRGP